MIYNIYIFNRKGSALFYREWSRPYNSFGAVEQGVSRNCNRNCVFEFAIAESGQQTNLLNRRSFSDKFGVPFQDERKLVYGMILSIKELVGKMKSSSADDGLHCLKVMVTPGFFLYFFAHLRFLYYLTSVIEDKYLHPASFGNANWTSLCPQHGCSNSRPSQ